jgi:hypothetical protein
VVLGAGNTWVLVGPQADPVQAAAASSNAAVEDSRRNQIVGVLDQQYYRAIDRPVLQKTAVASLPVVLDGVVQDIVPLRGGGALKFTMAEYLTPSGQRVNHQGILPDIEVASALVEGQAPIGVAASTVTSPSRNSR